MNYGEEIIENLKRNGLGYLIGPTITVDILHKTEVDKKMKLIEKAYHSADNSELRFK